MKILVTGAAGLLGTELVKQLLEKGYKVIAIYNSTPINLSHPNLKIEQCDILDMSALEEIMQGVSHVYHCAAVVSFEPKDKAHLFKINIEGTENIVNACINADVQKLVHVSSVAAIGRIRNGETLNEKMTWTEETSNSIYAKSKYLGEMEVWRGIGEGLQAAIVNPSIIIGGDNWNDGSSALFKSVYNGFKWYTEGVSGFVDVRDVAGAMILLMNSKISGERFILNAENLSYKEIFSLMAKGFGKNPPPNKVTPFLAEMVWRLEAIKSLFTGKKKLLTKETARTAQASVKYDNNKFLNAFSSFYFTPIAKSIAFTCATLKEKYHL
ncbi:MAG: NAD-dependent epimerase/dehydratase family protein [Bacteroidota bacterium]|nr:NAD-dependent epimerase/dehydratase family protein [Bacteroidota bacterium]